ncbi:hypothetical protein EV356DRAFT_501515 [Viridothelium virens]|uniref:Uncharacterized protein n=1 Tax=Viridothelium virens TaxID=1048519 RepID=A0A6A6H9G5_VIRVR|nr:hypothetical protein EV356DRAFT_501515 [Viridothelium virens]
MNIDCKRVRETRSSDSVFIGIRFLEGKGQSGMEITRQERDGTSKLWGKILTSTNHPHLRYVHGVSFSMCCTCVHL